MDRTQSPECPHVDLSSYLAGTIFINNMILVYGVMNESIHDKREIIDVLKMEVTPSPPLTKSSTFYNNLSIKINGKVIVKNYVEDELFIYDTMENQWMIQNIQ